MKKKQINSSSHTFHKHLFLILETIDKSVVGAQINLPNYSKKIWLFENLSYLHTILNLSNLVSFIDSFQ